MLRTTVFGVYDHGTYAALERVNDQVATPPEHEPRQRLWRISGVQGSRRRAYPSARWCSAIKRKRPSWHQAGVQRRKHLSQPRMPSRPDFGARLCVWRQRRDGKGPHRRKSL